MPARGMIRAEEALAAAQSDAKRFYGDLTAYRVTLALEDDGWHVDYEPKDSRRKGGAPHYIIDASTGMILKRRYEQ